MYTAHRCAYIHGSHNQNVTVIMSSTWDKTEALPRETADHVSLSSHIQLSNNRRQMQKTPPSQ
jgi:hypothetical protein